MANPLSISKFLHILQIYAILVVMFTHTTRARIGYFWHITDLHLDTIYSTQGDVLRSCWHIERQSSGAAPRTPGRFGDYLCDSPWSLIESAAKAMKSRQGDNVEFVLWTGDGLSHSAHPMPENRKMEILRNITDLLGRTFSSQFVFPVLGHEDGASNFRHMGELWRHWLPTEALHTFEKGGYYSIEQTKSRLRIIALNTNFMRHDPKYAQSHLAAVRQRTPNGSEMPGFKNYYYHHGNIHQHHGHMSDWSGHGYSYNGHHRGISVIPNNNVADTGGGNTAAGGRVSALSEFENQETEKQWLWLEEVLSKSKNNKETVYIVGHIPPGSDERHIGTLQNGLTTYTEGNNKRYLDLVRKYSSIIQGQFFGHLHSDSFRIVYDEKGKPVSWIMISPSVTPRKISGSSNNPAMRLYKFDTDSGQVLDYTQFYLDLQLANSMGEPNWVPEYNLTHYYALSDISAISLHNFVERFTGNDVSWFSKYYRANSVRYDTTSCTGVCLLNHYCTITRVDYKEFRQCLEKEQSALGSHAVRLSKNASPILIFLFAFILLYCQTLVMATKMFFDFIQSRAVEKGTPSVSLSSFTATAVTGVVKRLFSVMKKPFPKIAKKLSVTSTSSSLTKRQATIAKLKAFKQNSSNQRNYRVEENILKGTLQLKSLNMRTTWTTFLYEMKASLYDLVMESKQQKQKREQQTQKHAKDIHLDSAAAACNVRTKITTAAFIAEQKFGRRDKRPSSYIMTMPSLQLYDYCMQQRSFKKFVSVVAAFMRPKTDLTFACSFDDTNKRASVVTEIIRLYNCNNTKNHSLECSIDSSTKREDPKIATFLPSLLQLPIQYETPLRSTTTLPAETIIAITITSAETTSQNDTTPTQILIIGTPIPTTIAKAAAAGTFKEISLLIKAKNFGGIFATTTYDVTLLAYTFWQQKAEMMIAQWYCWLLFYAKLCQKTFYLIHSIASLILLYLSLHYVGDILLLKSFPHPPLHPKSPFPLFIKRFFYI